MSQTRLDSSKTRSASKINQYSEDMLSIPVEVERVDIEDTSLPISPAIVSFGAMASGKANPRIKLLVLGPSGAGKTSVLQRFLHQRFEDGTSQTVGADILRKDILVGSSAVDLEAWDTAGQERFRSLSSLWYKGAEVCCLVYDSTSEDSFKQMLNFFDQFCMMTSLNPKSSKLENFPLIVLANKCDLPNPNSAFEVRVKRWCKENGNIPLFRVSARTSYNVENAMLIGIERALQRKEDAEEDSLISAGIEVQHYDDPLSRHPLQGSEAELPTQDQQSRSSKSRCFCCIL